MGKAIVRAQLALRALLIKHPDSLILKWIIIGSASGQGFWEHLLGISLNGGLRDQEIPILDFARKQWRDQDLFSAIPVNAISLDELIVHSYKVTERKDRVITRSRAEKRNENVPNVLIDEWGPDIAEEIKKFIGEGRGNDPQLTTQNKPEPDYGSIAALLAALAWETLTGMLPWVKFFT